MHADASKLFKSLTKKFLVVFQIQTDIKSGKVEWTPPEVKEKLDIVNEFDLCIQRVKKCLGLMVSVVQECS